MQCDPVSKLVDIATSMTCAPDDVQNLAALYPLLNFSDSASGVFLQLPVPQPDVDCVVQAFREVASNKCWSAAGPHTYMLDHNIEHGWSLARLVTVTDIQDAYILSLGVKPTENMRAAIPWQSVPTFNAALACVDDAVKIHVPSYWCR